MRLNIEFSYDDVEMTFKFDSGYPTLKQISESIEFLEELTEKLEGIHEEILNRKPFN